MHLSIDPRDIENSFHKIAKFLINEHNLEVGNSIYQLSNIEFYYYNEKLHRDENCHSLKYKRAKIRQLLNSEWYVHKESINEKFRRKGIDFTCGDGESYGGILIKEVIRIEDNKKLSQSKFVDELICVLKPKDSDEFIKMIEEQNELTFIKSDQKNLRIEKCPRVGLAKATYKDSFYAFKI